ncbi:uncharacterized protein [Clytia hemisphaerica]|uniref:uncharacterized protein n=1 Tax=Clytia hemisphaerica TaxID=252671 RepID=UPI0034D59984
MNQDYIEKVKENRFMVSILETLYFEFPDFFFTYLPTGSLREGFGKMLPSTSILATDHDVMLVPDGVTVGIGGENHNGDKANVFTILESPDDHQAGFLWLKLEDDYLTHWHPYCMKRHIGTQGCSILSSFRWKKKIRQVLLHSMQAKRWVRDLESIFPWQNSSKNLIITVENNGPALTVDISAKCQGVVNCTRRSNKRRYFYADFTLALHCKPWPNKAEGFLTSEYRENWPPREALEEIKRLGCHVVPKSSTNQLIKVIEGQSECTKFSQSPGLEWRYSFSQAEIILAKHIPQPAKSAYLAFKAVVKRQVNKRDIKERKICTFALKCILYRLVERKTKSFWKTADSCLETLFMELLTDLDGHLRSRSCPNFWIPDINVFEYLTPDNMESKQRIVGEVMQDARHYVAKEWLEHCGCCRVGCFFDEEEKEGDNESLFDSFSFA